MTQTVNVDFGASLSPVGFAESVAVADTSPIQEQTSVAAFCDVHSEPRWKETVNFAPALHPAWFQSKIVCHMTTSKKNFRTAVDYVTKLKPLRYEETRFVRPKHLVRSYVSYLDYTDPRRRWFTTAVHLVPRTNSDTTIRNFRVSMRQTGSAASDGEDWESDSDEEDASHDVINNKTDVNMNVVKSGVTVGTTRHPPILISSGPDADNHKKVSHRTKVVVEPREVPAQPMVGDDYVFYLSGFKSTSDVTSGGTYGDVITNGYGDVPNGYLSGDSD